MCWKCNQKGHVQMNCPQNKEQESGMMASEKVASDNEVSFMVINESTEKKIDLWIGDTGASTHMKNTIDGLFDLRKEETIVRIGNGEGLKSTTVGTLRAIVEQADRTRLDVTLKNVAYVPELSTNLFSITKAMENGFEISSKGNIMSLSKGSKMVKFDRLQKTKNGFCPGIHMRVKVHYENANFASQIAYSEAHQKLGHPGEETTRATAKKLGWNVTIKNKNVKHVLLEKPARKI